MPADTAPETLAALAAIWRDMLGVKSVAPDDNFFALGGHSLLGVKMIGAAQIALGLGDELKPSDLMEYPTLGALAQHVDTLKNSEESGTI